MIPGWICAIIGLRQIKRDGTKGRWAAISALVLGAVWAVAIVGLALGGVYLFKNIITPDNAEAGMCVNIDHDGDSISMFKKGCGDDHDGQIVYVGSYGDAKTKVDPSELDSCQRRGPDRGEPLPAAGLQRRQHRRRVQVGPRQRGPRQPVRQRQVRLLRRAQGRQQAQLEGRLTFASPT